MTLEKRIEEKMKAWSLLTTSPKAGEKAEALKACREEAELEIEEGIEGKSATEILQQ